MTAGNITVQKGDDASISLVITNPDGSPFNAAGSTLTFTVKKNAASPPVITKPITSFTNGGSEATIALTADDLDLAVRAWRYEIALVDAGGLRRTSGLSTFYVTENNGQPGTISVVVGSTEINVAVTLAQLEAVSGVSSVNGRTGDVTLTKADVGLALADNTSDLNKPISTATQGALDDKAGAADLADAQVDILELQTDKIENVTNLIEAGDNIGFSGSGTAADPYGISVIDLPDGDKHYSVDFGATTALTVTHNLGKHPAVTVITSAEDEVEADVDHISINQFQLSFASAFGGKVVCN